MHELTKEEDLNEKFTTTDNSNSNFEVKIGDIVTFLSHPYISKNTDIIISGEHLMIPPLMVVIDIIISYNNEFNEHTGNPISEKGVSNCKCLWFSDKTNTFEENSFNSKQLKRIELNLDPLVFDLNKPKEVIGKTVALKTLKLELGKKKSVAIQESLVDKNLKTSIKSVLSFVSPVMQVLEFKKVESKEPTFDKRNGERKRETSLYEVKCRWYNPVANKYSEKFLPIESLIEIPRVPNEVIQYVQRLIKTKTYLKDANKLIKPESISFRSGFYKLSFFDYLLNTYNELDLPIELKLITSNFVELKEFYLLDAPSYNSSPFNPEQDIEQLLINAQAEGKKIIRIKYQNRHGKISYRTIKDFIVRNAIDTNGNKILLIDGLCLSKKEERTFKVSKIDRIWILNF